METKDALPTALESFKLINIDVNKKRSAFLSEEEKTLIHVEAQPFHLDRFCELLRVGRSLFTVQFKNDRWTSLVSPMAKVDITAPATEKEIALASTNCNLRMVRESPALYHSKIKHFLMSTPEKLTPLWISNIFQGIAEQDRIRFQNDEFIFLPDSKWNAEDLSSFYLLVIFKDSSLKTIRDLSTEAHLTLLKNLRRLLKEQLPRLFGIEYDQVRPLFHYHPTFYQLHLHVPRLFSEYPGCMVGRAHLLDDVIDNMLHFGSNFYANVRTLSFPVDAAADPDFYALYSS